MWFKNILRRKHQVARPSLFDESFLRRLERLTLQAQRTLRGNPASGEHLSRHRLPTMIFSDHRPYSPGDDYRHIDWNVYAHHEQMVVKMGEVEQNITVHILLDISRSMGWGAPVKLDTAKRLTAALGYLALAHSDQLRVLAFGETPLHSFGPAQGKSRLIELLRFVDELQPDQPTSLAGILSSYAKSQSRGGLLVLCSDLLTPEGLEVGLRSLTPPRWQVLVLHMLDRRELNPEIDGPIELVDAETGQRLPLMLDDATLSAYKRNVASWQEHIAATCTRRGASYAQILSHWPLERAVVPYLRARSILR